MSNMSKMLIQRKCPMCDEILEYEVTSHGMRSNAATIRAETTPKSTAHVWTHVPKESP